MNSLIEILLVEDNAGDIDLTTRMLKDFRTPYRLSVVQDGVEALAFLQRDGQFKSAPRPHLILLDLNLPKKDGRELLTEVKASPKLRRIPIIVLTTSNAATDIVKSYDLHANCYIRKPTSLASMKQVMAQIESFWLVTASLPPNSDSLD